MNPQTESQPSLSFHLIPAQAGKEGGAISLPKSPSYLDPETLEIGTEKPAPSQRRLTFEPHGRNLLVLNPDRVPLRVNDLNAPRVHLLEEGDHLLIGNQHLLATALYNCPEIGPPPSANIGRACPVCRNTFTSEDRVYHCGSCGGVLHLEEGDNPDESLQCALSVTHCLTCNHPINLEEGYITQGIFEQ
tara:strand:+ start:4990 stop:5556 length:567 start_codon:yes stop_codon:yes gene_type:complete